MDSFSARSVSASGMLASTRDLEPQRKVGRDDPQGKPPSIVVAENSGNGPKIPVAGSGKPGNTALVQDRLDRLNGQLEKVTDTQKLAFLRNEIDLLNRFQKYLALPEQLHAQQNSPDQATDRRTQLDDMRHAYRLLQRQSGVISSGLEKLYRSKGGDTASNREVIEYVRESFEQALDSVRTGIARAELNQQDKVRALDLPGLVGRLKQFQRQVELCYRAVDQNQVESDSTEKVLNGICRKIGSATKALEKINSGDLLSARQAARLANELREFIEVLGREVDTLDVERVLSEAWGRLKAVITDETALLDSIVDSSPLAKSKMYQAKQQMVQAAIDALQSVRADPSTNAQQEMQLQAQIAILETRKNALEKAANNPDNKKQLADPAKVIGCKPLDSFLDILFRGLKVLAQRKALDAAISDLTPGGDAANGVGLDLSTFNEQALMEGVLQSAFAQAGLSAAHDARDLYRRAHGDVLNKDPKAWGEIKVVMSTTTAAPVPPGGQKQAPLTSSFTNVIRPAREFGGQLSKTYDEHGLQGINSHCTTEYRHAVNFAKTETLDANGNKIFSAYRAATLSAYQITPEQMRKMPDKEVEGMLMYLLSLGKASPNSASSILFDSDLKEDMADVSVDSNQLASFVKKARTDAGFCAQLRAEAAYHRAREIVTGMVQDRLKNEPGLVDDLRAGLRAGITTIKDMCITSMSLLTPDMINLTGELRMQGEQFKAWERIRQEAENGTLTVKVLLPAVPAGPGTPSGVPEKQIDVGFKNLQILTFDFGVNSGAIGNTSWLPGSGGWNFADSHNAKGFEALFGKDGKSGIFQARYEKMMARHDELIAEIYALEEAESGSIDLPEHRKKAEELKLLNNQLRAVSELRQQIQQMWADKSYQDAGNEPYKMVSRLAVLGSLLGIQLVFNCKSGKDRTGETDAEAKYIASRIARGLPVHKPNDRLTDEEFRNRQWFVLRSGNHEMQAYNTGLGGYKLSGVDSLYKQFHRYFMVDFLGLSAYTRS